jgi:hypothetical protein
MPKQRGLQLPDPILPAGHFEVPAPLRSVPPGWRFRRVPPFVPGNEGFGLVIVGYVLVMVGCVVAALLLGAIAR